MRSFEARIGSTRTVETVSRSMECSASVEGGVERFESGDLLRKEKTSVPFRDHDPSERVLVVRGKQRQT